MKICVYFVDYVNSFDLWFWFEMKCYTYLDWKRSNTDFFHEIEFIFPILQSQNDEKNVSEGDYVPFRIFLFECNDILLLSFYQTLTLRTSVYRVGSIVLVYLFCDNFFSRLSIYIYVNCTLRAKQVFNIFRTFFCCDFHYVSHCNFLFAVSLVSN